ncbi:MULTISPECIES: hypothetical protein [unclassified Burkholderia]|uniref:hypothetical protein n=1 Tax=unclassified Burkholderia TaxID=2613784 RepID=UPI002AAF1DE5|nr:MULTISPECIES: hypothetical protein [unclassified Burkholderia]
MTHTISTQSLNETRLRWRAGLAPYTTAEWRDAGEDADHPAVRVEAWLEAMTASYASAAESVLRADGLMLSVEARGTDAVFRVEIDDAALLAAGEARVKVWQESISQGMAWLQQVLFGSDLMTRCLTAGQEARNMIGNTASVDVDPCSRFLRAWRALRRAYATTVWQNLRRMHADALAHRDVVEARCLPLFGSEAWRAAVRGALNSEARWTWSGGDAAGAHTRTEHAYLDVIKAHEQVRWIEAAALAVTIAHPYDVPRETESEPLMLIQTLGIGRAARLQGLAGAGASTVSFDFSVSRTAGAA